MTVSDKDFSTYYERDCEIQDELYRHFDSLALWDWLDIAEEGRRVWNLMFHDNVEYDSPIENVISAVAAAGVSGAIDKIAACLGISEEVLSLAIAQWSEDGKENAPPPVGFDGLKSLCEQSQIWLNDLNEGKFDALKEETNAE